MPSPNRLADETSPYLLQHQHNPIDWFPWGDEAIERAREQKKPIFLSVGYSACHWCHVMERESFEDEKIAAFLNEHFIAIKVDREERPDVDAIYMDAIQLMTGGGGWPMSVWLDNELRPFYAGTYFPPEARYGKPGFLTLLREIKRAWESDPGRIAEAASMVSERLALMASPHGTAHEIDLGVLEEAYVWLANNFDAEHGGFGRAPKFPQPAQLDLLLTIHAREDWPEARRQHALAMAEETLTRMASGGMYDHLGGGFHRYSVDEAWLIPHFEKMLYDNAQLVSSYVAAYRHTGRAYYADVARDVIDYVAREMVEPFASDARPFWSAQDADSEGEEGKFFVWTPAQIMAVLGEEEGARAAAYWGVDDGGNFERGTSALERLHALDSKRDSARPDAEEVARWRAQLFEARSERVAPATDTKVITSWNGLMIEALANAGVALEEPGYLEMARCAARFFIREMIVEQGGEPRLMRIYKDDQRKIPGYLEDHAFLLSGLLALFEATSEREWLLGARRVEAMMLAQFADEDGLFFATASHHTHLIVRQKPIHDGATPSGNSMALRALARMFELTRDEALFEHIAQGISTLSASISRFPHAFPLTHQALITHIEGTTQILVVSPDGEEEESALALAARALPREGVVVLVMTESEVSALNEELPWLMGRGCIAGKTTAYVCRAGACELPVTEVDAFFTQLAQQESR